MKYNKKDRKFIYRGDLSKEVEKSKKELLSKMREFEFIKWQFEKSKKEYDRQSTRIELLKEFIEVATEKIEKSKEQ